MRGSASSEITVTVASDFALSGDVEAGESIHSHEFIFTGTPTTSSDATTLNLTATVKISGDTPMLEASGSKEVKISATSSEPDTSPEPEVIPEVLQSIVVEIS